MIQLTNLHAHTCFSDGKFTPEFYLGRALNQGLSVYGFSDHAPIRIENFGSMPLHQLDFYLQEIDRLKDQFADRIQIYKGLEVDYIPGVIDVNTDYVQNANLDFTIGAVHFVERLPNGRPWGFQSSHEGFQEGIESIFNGDMKACIRRYYELTREMVNQFCPDIIAHLDRVKKLNQADRYFKESAPWYQQEVALTLEAIAKSGAIMEINTKGYYNQVTEDTYPGKWVLELAYDLGIPVHMASDAHHPDNIIKGFSYATDMLLKIGYRNSRMLYDGEWQDIPLKRTSVFQMK